MLTDRKIPQEYKDRIRVLVVEDNVLNQKLAGFMIRDWGFRHDIAANGKLAVEQLKLNSYDLILMDIEMPEMNGYDCTRYIREEMKLGLPIIATKLFGNELRRASPFFVTSPKIPIRFFGSASRMTTSLNQSCKS